MITTNNFLQRQIHTDMLLEKMVVNLCAEGHQIFACSQIIDCGKDSKFIDRLEKKGLLPKKFADDLRSTIDTYYEV